MTGADRRMVWAGAVLAFVAETLSTAGSVIAEEAESVQVIKPQRLRLGDTVGVAPTSSPVSEGALIARRARNLFPHRQDPRIFQSDLVRRWAGADQRQVYSTLGDQATEAGQNSRIALRARSAAASGSAA